MFQELSEIGLPCHKLSLFFFFQNGVNFAAPLMTETGSQQYVGRDCSPCSQPSGPGGNLQRPHVLSLMAQTPLDLGDHEVLAAITTQSQQAPSGRPLG